MKSIALSLFATSRLLNGEAVEGEDPVCDRK
jgi:hypothetical protein